MLMTLMLAALMGAAPGEAGGLTFTNARATYGVLGIARPNNKFLPGDALVLAFDIEGIKADDSGKVRYSIALEVSDGQGKVLLKQDPKDREAVNSLGGNTLPAYAHLQIGLEQEPGMHHVKVTVMDRTAQVSKSLMYNCQVLPKDFGLVRVTTTGDSEGNVPAAALATGEGLWVNFAATGFGRDAKGQPDLTVSMRVLDESGTPVTKQPSTGQVNKDVPATAPLVPMQFALQLNRAGKFTVELTGTDKVTNKTATVLLPLTVHQSK